MMSSFPAMILKLKNPVLNYAWGSRTALAQLFNIPNPDSAPQAEMWMGAHPKGCSELQMPNGTVRLDDFIQKNPEGALGPRWAAHPQLPYLFKILAAETALSIQVHPRLEKAQMGFAQENARGLPVDDPQRNYRDANHKPELMYALTPFEALCGFRPFSEISEIFQPLRLPALDPTLPLFHSQPSSETLKALFTAILNLTGEAKTEAIQTLLDHAQHQSKAPFPTILRLATQYPEDSGLFAPLLLNTITLSPGQALFLAAETPHAYLQGTGLEVMASSDNVLRGGLTPKYIDVPELTANIQFIESTPQTYRVTPIAKGAMQIYPVPVDDFAFATFVAGEKPNLFTCHAPEIVLCLAGKLMLQTEFEQIELQKGESCFIPASTRAYTIQGSATGARVTAAA